MNQFKNQRNVVYGLLDVARRTRNIKVPSVCVPIFLAPG